MSEAQGDDGDGGHGEGRPGSGGARGAATAVTAPLGRTLARAAAVTAALTVAGALCGLVRDQTIAKVYGASVDSDAFLISWTVPEMAATLLIEDAMALLLVPAFSHALARRAAGGGDPVRELVRATLPRLTAALVGVTGLLIVFAPQFVRLLAPGFADPALAVDCTRLTALTVLTYGLAGYLSAALRSHGHFLTPAGVYVASNAGIIATTLLLHSVWGVRAAAAGTAAGGLLMVLVQLPAYARRVTAAPPGPPAGAARLPRQRDPAALLGLTVVAPIVLFAVSRQAQVLVERFLASSLPGGAISHLNYAQKVAQMPMVLSLMFCTVTFPVVAQAMAEGDQERARRRVEHDLALAGLVVLLGTALILGYAPQIIAVLFERGAFDADDTATTAAVMRVYALGLLGHTLVGALGRPFFSAGRPTWYPAATMAGGLLVTITVGAVLAGPWGVYGIAAANAAGISATALLLLSGLGTRVVAIEVRAISRALGRLALAAATAALAGYLAAPLTGGGGSGAGGPFLSLAVGCVLVPAVFLVTGRLTGAPEVRRMLTRSHALVRLARRTRATGLSRLTRPGQPTRPTRLTRLVSLVSLIRLIRRRFRDVR
ncbi:murein biosynthesis integral membrane protein MurJ [Streptomyces sp. NPDC057638]|uniref:murein biosynthesis integral membrane protein MurJ n=1 Tax=Streptomyces sp. NPDC057638 TaxID=3346190 RepID=UPI0036AB07C3